MHRPKFWIDFKLLYTSDISLPMPGEENLEQHCCGYVANQAELDIDHFAIAVPALGNNRSGLWTCTVM